MKPKGVTTQMKDLDIHVVAEQSSCFFANFIFEQRNMAVKEISQVIAHKCSKDYLTKFSLTDLYLQ